MLLYVFSPHCVHTVHVGHCYRWHSINLYKSLHVSLCIDHASEPCKNAELIGRLCWPKYHVLDGGAYWCHLANTME